ncbi:MAG: hypothetical protein IPJ76_04050 [Flavobacteriales bacterium]|nr:MAG: hypothetical protein IPJ76_04050 [Flavobacteriales bacterium]
MSLHMDAVDLGWDQEKWLFVTDGWKLKRYKIGLAALEEMLPQQIIVLGTDFEGNRYPQGELEAILKDSELRVAFTSKSGTAGGNTLSRISYNRYDLSGTPLSTDWINVSNFPDYESCLRINGLEFSENGDYLYYLRSEDPELGYVDLSTLTVVPLTGIDMFDHRNSELESDEYGGVGGPPPFNGMYAMAPDGRLGRLELTNTPAAVTWDPDYLQFGLGDVATSFWVDYAPSIVPQFNSDCPNSYHLLTSQTDNFTPYPPDLPVVCCEDLIAYKGYAVNVTAGSTVWAPGGNPFGNTIGDAYVMGDLIVPNGANLTINNMTLRFEAGARLIVEAGAYLFCSGCTLTTACPGRWKGPEVRGNSNLAQTPFSNQGRFQTLNALVENAEVGAFVAKRNGNGGLDPAGYRGIVQSSNTTWKNNVIDVQIPSANGAGWTTWNQTRFQNCDFLTDQGWPDAWLPYAHAWLRDCGVIRFTNCRFRNTNTTFVGQDRGFGVFAASKAGPRVIGNNNPAVSFFEGLWCGVAVAKHRHYWVRNMDFRTSPYGIVDFGPTHGEVTGNTFNIPERGGQGPSPVGLLLYQTANYVVEDNLFQSSAPDANAGIAFWGPSETQNRIYNNNFEHLALGTYVIGDHQDEQNVNVIGLQKLCGDYTDNNVDYGMAFGSAIGGEQGDAFNQLALAGNRFFNTPDCSNNFDMAFVNPQPGSFFNYNRHDDADCDVICEDPLYMADVVPFTGLTFDEALHCAGGFGDGGGINIVNVTADMKAAKTQFESALAQYNGTVNGGKGADLLALINQESPWLSSHALRDSLLANHPLGEEVLLAMIHREEPMNGWHITQVMLQNAVVEGGVVETLRGKELVSPYQMALIEQAQASGNTSIKDVLEDEMHEQGNRHYMAQVNCLRYWMSDTVTTTAEDSILMVLEHGIGTGGRLALLLYHLEGGNWSDMEPIMLEPWYLEHKHTYLRDYVSSMRSAFGDPEQLSIAEIQHFELITGSSDAGSGLCWGTLLELDKWRDLPELDIPSGWRTMSHNGPMVYPLKSTVEFRVDPNPASGTAWVSWDNDMLIDRLSLYGPTGALLAEYRTSDGAALFELTVNDLPAGLYLLRGTSEGVVVGERKLTVVREQR